MNVAHDVIQQNTVRSRMDVALQKQIHHPLDIGSRQTDLFVINLAILLVDPPKGLGNPGQAILP